MTTTVKVAEYRNLIDAVSDAFASLRSAATPAERVSEADRVRRAARELMAASCPRAKDDDRAMAERLIDNTASSCSSAIPRPRHASRRICTGHRISARRTG
jgi:hypothetical protein